MTSWPRRAIFLFIAFILGSVSVVAIDWFTRPTKSATNQTTNQSIESLPNPESISQTRLEVSPDGKRATVFVPILMYHYIRDYTDPNDPLGIALSVAPATLDQQLKTLKDAGYHTISLANFVDGQYGQKPIILTFDDGYDDHYTAALPILQKYNFTATFFIVGGFVGRTGYVTKTQVEGLKAAGMEVAGHTMTHRNLATSTYTLAYQEISQSVKGLVPVFAYPSGKYSNDTLTILTSLRIRAAVTTDLGVATELSSLLTLPRIRVKEKTDILKVIAEEVALAKNPPKPTVTPTTNPTSTPTVLPTLTPTASQTPGS